MFFPIPVKLHQPDGVTAQQKPHLDIPKQLVYHYSQSMW